MLLHKSVLHDTRVRREAESLSDAGHVVTVVELADDVSRPVRAVDRVSAAPPGWVRRRLGSLVHRVAFALLFVRRGVRESPDVVHAHDAAMLLPGLLLATLTRARLVYDSHELATGVHYRERGWGWFIETLERLVTPRCSGVITVSDGIASRLHSKYRLKRAPTVLRNACSLRMGREPVGLRVRLGLTTEPLVVHQGAAAEDRGCEYLLEAVAAIPGAHLCFLGDGEAAVTARLRARAARAGVEHRVHFLPSVAPEALLGCTADADVGVSLLQDTCENHRLALPNKLFEYVAAGVPVVVSDLPEMRSLVTAHDIGWTVPPADVDRLTETLAEALARRDDQPLRSRVRKASLALDWQRERSRLLELYDELEEQVAA